MENISQHSESIGFLNSFTSWFATVVENRKKMALVNQTIKELNKLSDRELRDLGLHRAMIKGIAMESIFDNRRV